MIHGIERVQMDVYVVLIWCLFFLSTNVLGSLGILGIRDGFIGIPFFECRRFTPFQHAFSFMIPSRFIWVVPRIFISCIHFADSRAGGMYIGHAPMACTIQLNHDQVPEVDPWAAANILY